MRLINYTFTLVILPFLLVLFSENLLANYDIEEIKKDLPKMLGSNNLGNSFYFSFHPCYEEDGANNELKVYVSSGVATNVTLEIAGKGYKETKRTIPNDIIVFSLSPLLGQCYRRTYMDPVLPEQVYSDYAVHVYSEDPVICYGVTRYTRTSDGFLAIPVSSLGKEYIIASFADWGSSATYSFPSYTSIVAAYDNTNVRFILGGSETTMTAGGMLSGQQKDYSLNEGDVLLIGTSGVFSDLTGSRVIASKPVAVLSGNFCSDIPIGTIRCDYIIEMELPTHTWGKDYFVTHMQSRLYNSIIKIFAKEPDTKIYRDGRQIGIIPNVGGTLGLGYLEMRADDGPARCVVISGDKPIGVTQFNPGQGDDGIGATDPFQMVLTPLEQFQKEIIFNTPGIQGGYGFPLNYINIVYEANEGGALPDDFEIGTVKGSKVEWNKLSITDPNPGDPFAVQINGKNYNGKIVQLNGDGVYRLRAERPFTAYAYGYSFYDSYGFPTSVALGDLTKPDTVCPVPTWSMDCYGVISDGYVLDEPRDPEVRSNLSIIYFNSGQSFNFKFSVDEFIPGEDEETNWEANVIDPTKDARAVIVFSDRRGNDTTIVINFYAPKFTIRPDFVDFGLLEFGDVVDKTFWAINESKTSDILINELRLKFSNENFEVIGFATPIFIAPKDSIPFTVRFTGNDIGKSTFKDSIGIGDTCIFAFKSHIEARVGQPAIEVSDATFGDVSVGKTVNKDIYIKNSGSTQLVINSFSGPAGSVYKTNLPYISEDEPLIIDSGEQYIFTVSFTPDTENSFPDQIIFHSNAERTDSIAILNGRGIKSDLISNSYDWGRKRISRTNFPIDAYPADNDVIKLENNGSEVVKIYGLNIISDNKGNAFIFDRNRFDNLNIDAGSSIIIPVTFQPTETGEHELIIRYENSAGSETETVLKGIGILPRISTSDYDFGTTIVNDIQHPNLRTVVFTNTAWEYGDSLTITNFTSLPNGNSISSDFSNFGEEGFKYDKTALALPIVLQQGESIEIPAQFVSNDINGNSASLKSVSDAESDAVSNWNGSGVSQSLTATGGNAITCVDDIELIDCYVTNTGNGSIQVTALELSQIDNYFSFNTPDDANGFTLAEGESKLIVIKYEPFTKGEHTADLIVKNSTLEMPEITANPAITGTAEQFTRNTSVFIPADSKNPRICQKVEAIVRLDGGDDITLAKIQELSVVVNYSNGFLKVISEEIKLGSLISSTFNLNNLIIDDTKGEIKFDLQAKTSTDFLNGAGDLFHLAFDTFLPTQSDTSTFSVIKQTITAIGSACVVINNISNSIQLEQICIFDMRKIAYTGGVYDFAPINPNPVTSTETNFEFSVALEGWTEISIFDSKGQIVARPVAETLKPGKYSVNIPVEILNNGTYFCKMISGPYTETRSLVIVK